MTNSNDYKPEWIPDNAGDEFASRVMGGVATRHDGMPGGGKPYEQVQKKRTKLTKSDYVEGVLNQDRSILARAITLIESNSPVHMELAQAVLQDLLPHTGKSIRVGITGVPGAGKSTFIEALGCQLCDQGHNVAVLAVDPSSTVTKGSILGDKTRMENLSKKTTAFIRPSPSAGTLGGVTRKSRETLLLCEAAGYDTILVETVGVGQSETTVRSMVDFFLLVVLTGAGDELQGIKKGIMELADAILVNKADGDNKQRAMMARVDYERVLHYLRDATDGWKTKAYTCSAYTGEGIQAIWDEIMRFRDITMATEVFQQRRKEQTLSWVYSMVDDHLRQLFWQNHQVIACRNTVEEQISAGTLSATLAAQHLINVYNDNK